MPESNKKLDEIANQLDENILAVKGTLELIDTSVTEEELRQLLLKAINRMDIIQRLSDEILAALRNCFEKMGETRE
jgi:BMFP domain-containing protein YqiC